MVEHDYRRNTALKLIPVRIWASDCDYFDVACPDTNTIIELITRLNISDKCKWEILEGQEVIVNYV